MSEESVSDGGGRVRGVVRNGVIVLNDGHGLEEGTEVDVFLSMPEDWELCHRQLEQASAEDQASWDEWERQYAEEAKRDAG